MPVEPIMDALFTAVDAGTVVNIGASNWSHARIEAANAYAAMCGRTGSVGDQISYAYIRPQAPGGVGEDADESMLYLREGDEAWYAAHPDVRIFAYSSQARGYLTKTLSGAPMHPSIARTYDAPANRDRARRAADVADVAAELDVSVEAVGLAYLFRRAFPVHAVVGPHTRAQLDDTLQAARVVLDDAQLQHLEGSDRQGDA
ncbi:aldo/keto reductase [Microbacterium marinum]